MGNELAYSVTEVQRLLGVSKPTVLAALHSGALPAQRLGRRWIIGKVALDRWLTGESSAVTYNDRSDSEAVAFKGERR